MLVFRHAQMLLGAAFMVVVVAVVVLATSLGEAAADIAVPPENEAEGASGEQSELECGFLLTDQGDVLGDATPVVVAAGPLERFGTVRIRVFDQTATGSLDDALAEIANNCGWIDENGEYQPDIFVFGVSVEDRATRVLYGSSWAPTLDDSASVIIDRVVNSQFGTGNYQGGIIGGLEQFASLRGDGEPAAETLDTTVPPTGDVPDTAVIDAPPVDEPVETIPLSVVPIETGDAEDVAATETTPTVVETQGAKMSTYLLIGGVLIAIIVLPAIFLARSRNDA